MAKKKATQNPKLQKVCGNCEHFHAGLCYFGPPVLVLGLMHNRPPVSVTTKACGQFKKE